MEEPKDTVQECAEIMYDVYCDAVGGKAFNGDLLPGSNEFFADPNKQKQANAWIAAARASMKFWGIK
jgi:hypothetical protein